MSKSRPKYVEPSSFARVFEAALATADADSEDDIEYHAAEMRLRAAVNAHAPKILGSRGGRASAAMLTPEDRRTKAQRAAQARWAKRRPTQD
jgi:hypothetical protein